MKNIAILVLILLSSTVLGGQPTANDLIGKFRKSIGAEDSKAKNAYVIKYRGQRFMYTLADGRLQGQAIDFEATLSGLDGATPKDRTEVEMKIGIVPFRYIEAVDGGSGWYQINDSDPVAMSKNLVQGRKQRDLHVDVFLGRVAFEPDQWQFTEPKSKRVRGQDAWEFDAKRTGFEPMTLSFAKDSNLLLGVKSKAMDYELLLGADAKVENYVRELHFYDWKKFGNRMLPGHFDVFQNGVLWKKMEPTSISFPDALDVKIFAMPELKK